MSRIGSSGLVEVLGSCISVGIGVERDDANADVDAGIDDVADDDAGGRDSTGAGAGLGRGKEVNGLTSGSEACL